MEKIKIDLIVPQCWHELTDKQLRYIYRLIASEYSSDEIKTMCLLAWSGTKVVGRQDNGLYLLERNKTFFEVSSLDLAGLIQHLDWIDSLPKQPVCLSRIKHNSSLPTDFSGVPFETYIMVDNLYQGYLQIQDDAMLDDIAEIMYGKRLRLKPEERISIFYWVASLKDFFARRYPDFLKSVSSADDGNLLGASQPNVEDAMNAQIRALTKGDVTKEKEILALDTWRALTELNAQAKEYQQLNAKINAK